MTLVEELRKRYRARGEMTSRLIETGDRQAILARGAAIRQAYRERLTDPLLPGEPLEAETVGVLEFPDYTIEKIVLRGKDSLSIPTNLYLPRPREARCPAAIVLSGHWLHAKAMEAHQRLCANLAMRGIAAFTYDPLYQGERCPYTPAELEAMFGPLSEDMWMVNLHMRGGNLAYLLGGNIGALFLWEARRVLDCLCARPEIDRKRIAAVGQSGGGTQACYLAALDNRISLYAPVQCLSQLAITLEEGIGDCEQSLYGISREQGVEQWDILWAALPKPVLHSAAQQDFFALEGVNACAQEMYGVYQVLGQKEDYTLKVADCGHEFCQEARCHVYGWLTERFFGRRDETERPMVVLSPEALRCLEGPPEEPEQLYARQLQILRERRPTEDRTVLATLETLLESQEKPNSIEMLQGRCPEESKDVLDALKTLRERRETKDKTVLATSEALQERRETEDETVLVTSETLQERRETKDETILATPEMLRESQKERCSIDMMRERCPEESKDVLDALKTLRERRETADETCLATSETLQKRRETTDETPLAALKTLREPQKERFSIETLSETDTELSFYIHVPYNETAFCRLHKKASPYLRIIVSQETPVWFEEASTLQVIPWAMESSYRKQRSGYDSETCLFNISAVLGRNLALHRAVQIRAAADYAIRVTGASQVSALGVGSCALPLLLASCTDPRLRPLALARCQISWDDLFQERKYFLPETSILPEVFKIADLPRLCALSDATVFNPLHADGQPYTPEEVRREERVSCIWEADLAAALDNWFNRLPEFQAYP